MEIRDKNDETQRERERERERGSSRFNSSRSPTIDNRVEHSQTVVKDDEVIT
jgi:hypothetical protein